jgi:DNA-binding NtrC family response regulator
MKRRQPLLAIDDDSDFVMLLETLLAPHGYSVQAAATLEEALRSVGRTTPGAILLDWQLGGESGFDLIEPLRDRLPNSPIILSTAFSSTDLAVRAIQLGAFDFLPKPLDEARLLTSLARAYAQHDLLDRVDGLGVGSEADCFEGMIGTSEPMRSVFQVIANVAKTDASVLVTGESGTGKELVAKAIHQRSSRSRAPFLALNMAAIPKELVESTLFGHEKGAFSGADRTRKGACEEAHGGTLFLDEIGEMPLDLQPKLLRFLQEQTVRRVGGSSDVGVDVRIVSATNRDPLATIEEGRLRADLYYRLNVVPIALPPLRERPGDVALLATRMLATLSHRYGKEFREFGSEALELLEAYPWPGNVRELLHTLERTVITQAGETVRKYMLPEGLRSRGDAVGVESPRPTDVSSASSPEVDLRATHSPAVFGASVLPLTELERMAIEHALRVCQGSREEAARALGISPATIYRKLKQYGITKSPRSHGASARQG